MKKAIIFVFIIIVLQSCNIFNNCKKFTSDSKNFRSYAEATSTTHQFAEEKALLSAKNAIAQEIDNFILEKYNHKTFLADSEYENKINFARKNILSNINIVCSKSTKKGDMFKSSIAIEISKSEIENVVSGILKSNIY